MLSGGWFDDCLGSTSLGGCRLRVRCIADDAADGAGVMKNRVVGRLAVYWVLIVVFGSLLASGVHAETETINATATAAVARWKGDRLHGTTGAVNANYYEGATADSVGSPMCAYTASTKNPAQTGTFTSFNASFNRADCTFSAWGFPNNGGNMSQYCPAPSTQLSGASPNLICQGGTTYSCPANQGWQLNGTTCVREVCAAGQARYNGVCQISCPYPGKGGPASGQQFQGEGSAPATLCIGGCTYRRSETVSLGGVAWTARAGTSTGVSCSTSTVGTGSNGEVIAPAPSNTPQPPTAAQAVAKCAAKGQGWGEVNGVVSCSGSSGVTTESVETTSTESTPVAGGPTEKTTTETKTTCIAGVCTS